MKNTIRQISIFTAFLVISSLGYAKGGGGGHALGLGFGIVTASQDDLENHTTTVNQLGGGRSAAKPGSALEFDMYYEYRFSGTMFAMQFRPSYYTQSGSGGTDKTSLTGYTFFPLVRFYPLENSFIRFFILSTSEILK